MMDEDLMDQVKASAVARGTSASKVVTEAVREFLVKRDEPRPAVVLPTCTGQYIGKMDSSRTTELLLQLDDTEARSRERF